MPYLPPTTVAESLAEIQKGELVLPAIQREFVWKPSQVTALFDSLLRGYPIGSFLSWRIEPETARQFKFYGFMRDYNQLNQRHSPVLDVPPDKQVNAVLDGQQRLTSLNIGLRGSYAWKKKYGWTHLIENYPRRVLHVNLAQKAPENAAGLEYDFRFLTEEQLQSMPEEERRFWLPVPSVYEAQRINTLLLELSKREVANSQLAMETATDLWAKVHSEKTIYFYQENRQDIERVLDIFIRVNSAGTTLSYSDLLLSIATAQWTDRDARQEVHGLVDELNAVGAGFRFTQDLVLKAGLVLSGVPDIGFKVKNFTAENMRRLSDEWDRVSNALRVAAGLLSDFGLSGATLTARSILIPIATYVHARQLTQNYRVAPGEAADRAKLKEWTLKSLIIPGVWGSGLDQLLRALRETIQIHGTDSFPLRELERTMASRGKPLTVTPELVESLLGLRYGDASTFAVLAILFPHVNTRNQHHVDHVYPASRLARTVLRKGGHPEDEIDALLDARDTLPNLQLLEGPENISKSAKTPKEWAETVYPDPQGLANYMDRNLLPSLPSNVTEFLAFVEERKQALKTRLLDTLGAVSETKGPLDAEVLPPLDEAPEAEALDEWDSSTAPA
jgi:hypothetical protein